MFVKRLVDKYRSELIKPSINKRSAPSVCFITCPASSSSTALSIHGRAIEVLELKNLYRPFAY